MEGWLESDTRDKLEDHIRTTSLPIIRKIVCFGLGSFSLDYKRDTAIHIQHAAIATMAEALQQKEGTAIKCFVQDPAYTDADKELLRELGLTVLADPKGFLEIDKDTLVFDCGCLYALDDIVADLCRPAALCWDTVHSSLEEKVEACMQWADGHNTVETDENGVSWAK